MKVVINGCYGGFSLSTLAIKRLAELQGRNCYFFRMNLNIDGGGYTPITAQEAEKELLWVAFDTPNINELLKEGKKWHDMNEKEKEAYNRMYRKHQIDVREYDRNDPMLIQIVEELGEKAGGKFAQLKIVEIPDGIKYQIEEYDGNEWVAEEHRTWR